MSRLTRYTQKLFGSTAGTGRISEFGSLQAGTPTTYSGTTVTPVDIQALSNFLQGWDGAVIGNNSPAIQDLTALDYLWGYQLSYILQVGIPEWDAGTTYYQYNYVTVNGVPYVSDINNNTGNSPTTSPSDWTALFEFIPDATFFSPLVQTHTSTGSVTGNIVYCLPVSSANATAGATYTNNGFTFTVLTTISANTYLFVQSNSSSVFVNSLFTLTRTSGTGDPTITFAPISGASNSNYALNTYQPAANSFGNYPVYLEVEMVGAGAGGSGNGITSSPVINPGNAGTFSVFSTLIAGGGLPGGSGNPTGGGGGTNNTSISGPYIVGLQKDVSGSSGGSGATLFNSSSSSSNLYAGPSGYGGQSAMGGGAAGQYEGSGGIAPATNSGSGGGGAGQIPSVSALNGLQLQSGAGGGSGGYLKFLLLEPEATPIYFCVGALGAGGAAGTNGYAGGYGAAGYLVITAYYQ